MISSVWPRMTKRVLNNSQSQFHTYFIIYFRCFQVILQKISFEIQDFILKITIYVRSKYLDAEDEK
jgi:hypothetical protein